MSKLLVLVKSNLTTNDKPGLAVTPPAAELPAQLVDQSQLAKWVDGLGALDEELAPAKVKLKRMTELPKLVATHCGLETHMSAAVDGNQYTALIGAKELESSITSLAKVFAAVGQERFLDVSSLTLKALESLKLPPGEERGLIETPHTGSRDVKIAVAICNVPPHRFSVLRSITIREQAAPRGKRRVHNSLT